LNRFPKWHRRTGNKLTGTVPKMCPGKGFGSIDCIAILDFDDIKHRETPGPEQGAAGSLRSIGAVVPNEKGPPDHWARFSGGEVELIALPL